MLSCFNRIFWSRVNGENVTKEGGRKPVSHQKKGRFCFCFLSLIEARLDKLAPACSHSRLLSFLFCLFCFHHTGTHRIRTRVARTRIFEPRNPPFCLVQRRVFCANWKLAWRGWHVFLVCIKNRSKS